MVWTFLGHSVFTLKTFEKTDMYTHGHAAGFAVTPFSSLLSFVRRWLIELRFYVPLDTE